MLKYITGDVDVPVPQNELEQLLPAELHFALYAARFWPYHASKFSAASRARNRISNETARFLTSVAFRDWHILMLRILHIHSVTLADKYRICHSFVSSHETLPDQPNPIYLVSAFGLIECLEEPAIARRIPDHERNLFDETPLLVACRFGNTETLGKFLAAYPDQKTHTDGATALGNAVCSSTDPWCRYFFSTGLLSGSQL